MRIQITFDLKFAVENYVAELNMQKLKKKTLMKSLKFRFLN
jgi:hypothetical protein